MDVSVFEKDSSINPNRLDEECLKMAGLFAKYSGNVSFLNKKKMVAKENLNFIESSLKRKIRKNPKKYGINGSPTNEIVKEVCQTKNSYREAYDALIQSTWEVDEANTLLGTIETKKYQLNNLIQLFLSEYYINSGKKRKERRVK